jgi:hypothetical protein
LPFSTGTVPTFSGFLPGIGHHYNQGMNSGKKETEKAAFNDRLSEYLAWLMDSSIQIGPVSFGLDGLIGVIPGLGDVTTSIVSALIILRAIQNGVHRAAIIRMLMNVGLDTLLGMIPLVGDIFDLTFKSNIRNLQIYREAMSGTRNTTKDWAFIVVVVFILIALMVLPIIGLIYLFKRLTP